MHYPSCPHTLACAPAQDHPDDRAWFKTVFDFVAPSGVLKVVQVPDLLTYFYRSRVSGPTQSGSFIALYPEAEAAFIMRQFPEGEGVDFEKLMNTLQEAQGPRARDLPTAHALPASSPRQTRRRGADRPPPRRPSSHAHASPPARAAQPISPSQPPRSSTHQTS